MRTPRALSPSAFMLWESDPNEYCLRYLSDTRPEREAQPMPASVGSSFDAFVKAKLHADIFGEGADPEFEFTPLFESQVEEHNRDEALKMGEHVFDDYCFTGAYDKLLKLMENAREAPRFEFDASATIGGMPLFGKPDCRFVDKHGNHIILDWKVSGYCSKYGASPTQGFMLCTDGRDWIERNLTKPQLKKRAAGGEVTGKHSGSHEQEHKKYLATDHNGVTVNAGFLETCNHKWATQLSIYGWTLGEDVGDENVIMCVDEIVAKFMGAGNKPLLRVVNHRSRVSREFQLGMLNRMQSLWNAIGTGHIFPELSRDENDAKLNMIYTKAAGMVSDGSPEEDWFADMGRPSFR